MRLGKMIGRGPATAVYLAAAAGKRRAVKRLDGQRAATPAQRAAFARQVDLMHRLAHPAIVAVAPAREGDELRLDMELLDGITLERVTRRLTRVGLLLPIEVAVFAAREVLRALAHLHALVDEETRAPGIVHGQIEPKEVMLVREGAVKLLAFGPAARAQLPPVRQLRPALYRAPEQILGRPIDPRADVFAVGALLWELLVGPPLFWGVTEAEAAAAVLGKEVPPPSSLRPSVSAGLDAIVLRMLARDPARRVASADAAAEELGRFLPPRDRLTRRVAAVVTKLLGPLAPDSRATPRPAALEPTARARAAELGPVAEEPDTLTDEVTHPRRTLPLGLPPVPVRTPSGVEIPIELETPTPVRVPAPRLRTPTLAGRAVPPPLPPGVGRTPAARPRPPLPSMRPTLAANAIKLPGLAQALALQARMAPSPPPIESFVSARPPADGRAGVPTRPGLPPRVDPITDVTPTQAARGWARGLSMTALQVLTVATLGFLGGMLWQEQRLSAAARTFGSPEPTLLGPEIAPLGPAPDRAPEAVTEAEPARVAEEMVVVASVPTPAPASDRTARERARLRSRRVSR